MRNKKIFMIFILASIAASIFLIRAQVSNKGQGSVIEEIHPFRGSIEKLISSTATVLPKNRLEIKPPVNGRVERMLVKEGDIVKVGQVLAEMSSTERAALLDAARGKGEETFKYWEEVYKAISLFSPIDGEIIVATTQPGQTVTTSDAVVVLSDHMIVRAQVDETDIGKIKIGQKAYIALDAFPDEKIDSSVEHIYYESETINNVTVYKVDLKPDQTPVFFRSGMNATVDFIAENKEKALLVPVAAVKKENNRYYCLIKEGQTVSKREVQLGMTDDKNYEVISGLTENDSIILSTKKYVLPSQTERGTNPFMPKMPRPKKGSEAVGSP
ncbi:MAG TPA: HlyD family efflux transporter periplasmic adaptor subunit [Candidatus Omnitrophota bacterium]|nr:HlyD family efflux transporter periplasmic adaptor subunit [Candidatus Omnitrophota bacterium]